MQVIPLDKGDYRPDQVSKSALELAWHIAASEMRFMASVPAGEFDITPRPRPDSIRNMYLRPTGAKVPSIYGESYDAAEARKAAQDGR